MSRKWRYRECDLARKIALSLNEEGILGGAELEEYIKVNCKCNDIIFKNDIEYLEFELMVFDNIEKVCKKFTVEDIKKNEVVEYLTMTEIAKRFNTNINNIKKFLAKDKIYKNKFLIRKVRIY